MLWPYDMLVIASTTITTTSKSKFTCSNEEYIICFPIWRPDLLVNSYFCKSVSEMILCHLCNNNNK